MKHTIKAIVNLPKGLLALAIALFFLIYSIFYLTTALWIEATVFFLVAATFFFVFFIYCSTVVVSREGVFLRFLSFNRVSLNWKQIKEIGVIGEKVFNRTAKKDTGTKYIYFSTKKLTEQQRFELALNWPPRRTIYLIYREEHIALIQYLWGGELELYNAVDLDIYTGSVKNER